MKKLITLLCVITLLFGLCACSAKSGDNISGDDHIPSLPQSSDSQGSQFSSEPYLTVEPENTASHTHKFDNATCTQPAKCSCGKTNGKAAGHKWTAATCKAPKTCTVCKITEGSKSNHSYKNGKCSVCGQNASVNPKTDLIYEKELLGNFRPNEDELLASGISFYNNDSDGLHCVLSSHNFTDNYSLLDNPDPASIRKITYQSTTYYHYGAGQSPYYIELTDSEIIVKNVFWDDNTSTVTLKLVMLDANNLKVTYSNDSDYPVGTILALDWQN